MSPAKSGALPADSALAKPAKSSGHWLFDSIAAIIMGLVHLAPFACLYPALASAMAMRGHQLQLPYGDIVTYYYHAALMADHGLYTVPCAVAEYQVGFASKLAGSQLMLLPDALLFSLGLSLNQIILIDTFAWPALFCLCVMRLARRLGMGSWGGLALALLLSTLSGWFIWNAASMLLSKFSGLAWSGMAANLLKGDMYLLRPFTNIIPPCAAMVFIMLTGKLGENPQGKGWIAAGLSLGCCALISPFYWMGAISALSALTALWLIRHLAKRDNPSPEAWHKFIAFGKAWLVALPIELLMILRQTASASLTSDAAEARLMQGPSLAHVFPDNAAMLTAIAGAACFMLLLPLLRTQCWRRSLYWELGLLWSSASLLLFCLFFWTDTLPFVDHFLSQSAHIGLAFLLLPLAVAAWGSRISPKKCGIVLAILLACLGLRLSLLAGNAFADLRQQAESRAQTLAYLQGMEWLRQNTPPEAVVGSLNGRDNIAQIILLAHRRPFVATPLAYTAIFERYWALGELMQTQMPTQALPMFYTGLITADKGSLPAKLEQLLKDAEPVNKYEVLGSFERGQRSYACDKFSAFCENLRRAEAIRNNERLRSLISQARLDYLLVDGLALELGAPQTLPGYANLAFRNEALAIYAFDKEAFLKGLGNRALPRR